MKAHLVNHANSYLNTGLMLAALLAYTMQNPIDPINGDTVVGYGLGIMAALMVLLLTFLGARKRWFIDLLGSYKAWVSSHIQVGLALFLLSLMHSGFQLGWNLHSLTFVLMTGVIVSGIYGVTAYQRFPARLRQLTNGINSGCLVERINNTEQAALRVAKQLGDDIFQALHSAIQRTDFPRPGWRSLLNVDGSRIVLPGDTVTFCESNIDQTRLSEWLALAPEFAAEGAQRKSGSGLLQLHEVRRQLLRDYREALRLECLIRQWLKFHLCLSLAFVGCLLSHIVLVLQY